MQPYETSNPKFDLLPDRQNSESVKWHYFEPDVLPMWVADMDFRSPEAVTQVLQERIRQGVFGYPVDLPELKETICAWLNERYRWKVDPVEVVLLPGVVSAFNLVARLVGQVGDGLLIQPPVYHPFLLAPAHSGRTRQDAPLHPGVDGSYPLDPEVFTRSIDDRTRLLLMSSPHNPVGRVFRRSELEFIAETCLRKGVRICSDEVHSDLVYPGQQHVPMATISPEVARNTVTLMAPSKTFNIAGLGCSFAVVLDADLRKRMEAARFGPVGHVNLLGQYAALAAYQQGADWLAELLVYLRANRDYLVEFVRARLPGVHMHAPEATYLAWMDCRGLDLPVCPAEFFRNEAKVGLNDGAEFGPGGEGYVRLNFGCPRSMLAQALERMESALRERGVQ